uniref:Putative ribonuclease H-like domain-containing protein n=1 Tax=Tanacetum cinerariifolium TaxID=118510 RepID=A0A699KGK2_TANCI|nr:putative ribonuclease H-like domain-containing protein [Tanacetum cinerariifolium]
MIGNLKLLINFIWKFMGTVCFGNHHVPAILGFGDLQWENILITRVYFVEGLGHNLFSVGQFYDSDLEVAFRRNVCFVRNLEGVDLLKGDRSTHLYIINLHEMASTLPICLMARASSTKFRLWHQLLSHLNFDTINDLARNDLVAGLPKFKYHKEHLCLSYQPKVTKPKKVGTLERLATPKPRKHRFLLRWSPTGRLFDQKGNIVDSNESESQSDRSKCDNACTSNILEPKIKRFPNSTSLLNKLFRFVYGANDHVAAILGFGDLQWGNILITRVYFVEGLGHNLFSIGQFCDSNLEVAFRRNACFVRNLEGVDLLKRDRSTNLYTINLHEMASASPICLMARASSTKSWLWHQRLSHLNFDTINDLARNDLVSSLPKFKYHKEHLCPSCEQGKCKRASHPPKPVPNSRQMLHLLHMDLCGPMRIASINGKRYVLVIVDDYSRYTWVYFLRSKDKAPAVIITFLKRITILLQSPVIIIRTDNGTEFKNQVLKEYFDTVGISHQMSSVRTPQQNGVVERRNQTLVEAARTMLIFSRASLFLWAEAIATACFTQNRSIIHR